MLETLSWAQNCRHNPLFPRIWPVCQVVETQTAIRATTCESDFYLSYQAKMCQEHLGLLLTKPVNTNSEECMCSTCTPQWCVLCKKNKQKTFIHFQLPRRLSSIHSPTPPPSPPSDFTTLSHTFVTLWLHYCKSLYIGMKPHIPEKLPLVQDAAAHLEHISLVFWSLP